MRNNNTLKKFVSSLCVLSILLLFFTFSANADPYSFLTSDTSGETVYGLKNFYISFKSWSGFTQETRWAIDYASAQWNNKTSQTRLYHNATQHNYANKWTAVNGQNLISKVSLSGTTDASALMITTTYYQRVNSVLKIAEADIVINADKSWANNGMATAYDVQNVMTHEFGHMLGLDHSTTTTATMYEHSYLGETSKRVLHQHDLNGFHALYY